MLETAYLTPELPANRSFQVVGFGLNAVDWICAIPAYPPEDAKVRIDQLYRLGGGQVATACALCARYGLKVRYVGRVGDDETGEFSRQDLQREPLDLCLETVADAFSQYAFIIVSRPRGTRTIFWDRDDRLLYSTDDLQRLRGKLVQGQVLHIDGHDQPAAIQAACWARETGMKVCLDVDKVQSGVEQLLALVDYAVPSVNFAKSFAGTDDWEKAVLKVQQATDGIVIVTRGMAGCAVVWEGEVVRVPGFEIDDPLDSTGAGDVFHGAFIYGLFQNWNLKRHLEFCNAAGALSCRRYGARAGIPAMLEAKDLMEGSKWTNPESKSI